MNWLYLALFAPLMFAISGFIDKYAISKVAANASAGALIILSGACCLPFVIMFGIFGWHDIISASLGSSLMAALAGSLEMIGWYFYFRALDKADASLIIALFQISIVFNYVLGFLFLGETPSLLGTIAIVIIGVAAVALNIESHEGKLRFSGSVFALSVVSTLFVCAGIILFKASALDSNFLAAQFWMYAANCIVGSAVLLVPSARRSLWRTLKKRPVLAVSIGFGNEVVYLIAVLAQNYAMLLAPVAIVQAVLGVQSVYMIIMGAVLTKFWPRIISENISRRHLLLKFTTVLAMIGGMVLLAF